MVSVVVAIIFIACGFILMRFPLKSRNCIYGYRTTFAMKNQETWDLAQKHGGLSMIILGFLNGIFGIWATIQPIAINNEFVQMSFLLIGSAFMIVFDEIYLKKLFNKDGSRK